MDQKEYTIQELTDASGVARRNIYFYTQQGILPPPEGAGLAARYGEVHLLRLKAVPILRDQGLRLDEIRRRLQTESLESLRRLTGQQAQVNEQPLSYGARDALDLVHTPVLAAHDIKQYSLPGGVTISAPAVLAPAEARRLARLLEAAREIYFAPRLPQDGGKD